MLDQIGGCFDGAQHLNGAERRRDHEFERGKWPTMCASGHVHKAVRAFGTIVNLASSLIEISR